MGQNEDAIAPLEEAVYRDPDFLDARLVLACAYCALGHKENAQQEARAIQKLNPRFSIAEYAAKLPYKDQDLQKRFGNDLRKAGLPV